jgi:hypothetical protein
MSVNPGERYPRPKPIVTFARSNAVLIAFVAGQLTGIGLIVLALVVRG